ncbi:MAG TPA: hypothetical protein ENG74_01860 [Thermoplasmatales archaeon]|nr:hypothetical protein [Thermoplasmatales archaeon]
MDRDTHQSINGIKVKATCTTNSNLFFENISSNAGCLDDESYCQSNGGCYTFAEINLTTGERIFKLDPNQCTQWRLETEEDSRYYAYLHPTPISVTEGRETRIDIYLEHKPTPATIKGRVIDKNTRQPLCQYVSLYENGNFYTYDYTCSHNYEFLFEIPFPEGIEERCFTLVTYTPQGFSHASTRSYPYIWNKHCGDFPDCEGWGKSYNYRGWSSSVCEDVSCHSSNCNNPWFGSSTTDRICVTAGQEVDLGDIELIHVPQATLKGYVRYEKDGEKHPVSNATVYINWHPSTASYMRWQEITTDENGYFVVSVPAEQELFPDENNFYLYVRASGALPVTFCCNREGEVRRYSSWQRVGPLYIGDEREIEILLPLPADYRCGNAQGKVIDAKTEEGIEEADIYISGYGWRYNITDSEGRFELRCPPNQEGYAVPIGRRRIIATQDNYYPCDSRYNWRNSNYWYNPSIVPEIVIEENKIITHPDIKLWPRGYGNLRGRVLRAGETNPPVEGAEVSLTLYTGETLTSITNSQGDFEFTHIPESWPPPDLPEDDPYYNHTPRPHNLRVEHPDYETYTNGDIQIVADQTTTLTIYLSSGGGM